MDKNPNKFIKPKKNYTSLLESKYVQKWLENVKSKQGRLGVLKKFCNFLDKTPENLILEHHEDLQRKPLERTDIAKKQLHSYFGYLTANIDNAYQNKINEKKVKKPVAWNSARQYVYSKILSFYKRNKVPVVFEKGEIPASKGGTINKVWTKGEKKLVKDDKRECLKNIVNAFNSIRNRTIVLCKISSGLDDVDLFKLKVKDFNNGYFEDYGVCYIDGNRQKNGVYFQTFFNSEACDSIKLMLKDRERKDEVITERSWLFVGNKKVKDKYTQMKPPIFYKDLAEVCEKLNINNVTPKSFRRYFNSTIKRDLSVDQLEVAERMMGHTIGVSASYQELFNDMEEFTAFYVENIEHKTLLFTTNGRINKLDKKIEELEKENENLQKKMEEMEKSHAEQIADLKEELMGAFEDLYYRKETEKKVKNGEITEEEAKIEHSGFKK